MIDIDAIVYQVAQKYGQIIIEDVVRGIMGFHPSGMMDGFDVSHFEIPMSNGVSIRITASGWQFWMSEFGKGSDLSIHGDFGSKLNPWLNEYIASSIFNKERLPDFAILNRSTGQNLETIGNPDFMPFEGRHFLEMAIETYMPLMKVELLETLNIAIIWSIEIPTSIGGN